MISNHTKPTALFSSLSLKLSSIFLCEHLFACWTFSQELMYIFWFITKVWRRFFKSSVCIPCSKTHSPSRALLNLCSFHLCSCPCFTAPPLAGMCKAWEERSHLAAETSTENTEKNPTSLSRLHIYLLAIQQSFKGSQAVEQPEG